MPEEVIYLDGNSLGALPVATAGRLSEVTERQWGENLIANYDAYSDFLVKNGVLKDKVSGADLVTNDLIDDMNKFDAKEIEAQAKGWKG